MKDSLLLVDIPNQLKTKSWFRYFIKLIFQHKIIAVVIG